MSDTLHQQIKATYFVPSLELPKSPPPNLLSELAGKELHSARQLATYAGLTPEGCRSGCSSHGKTVLCKICNRFLRKTHYLPAGVAKRYGKASQPWITKLQNRKLPDLAIRGAIMRKLLHSGSGVLVNQQPFNLTLVFIRNAPLTSTSVSSDLLDGGSERLVVGVHDEDSEQLRRLGLARIAADWMIRWLRDRYSIKRDRCVAAGTVDSKCFHSPFLRGFVLLPIYFCLS